MSHFGSRCCPKYVSAKPLTIFNLPMPALDDLACADLPGAIDPGFVDLEVRLLRNNSPPQVTLPPKILRNHAGCREFLGTEGIFNRGDYSIPWVKTLLSGRLSLGFPYFPPSKMEENDVFPTVLAI